MGRLYIKPQKSFVKVVSHEPRHRGQQWLVAIMFTVGCLTTVGGIVWAVAKLIP